jgi:hypothetical protein
MMHRRDFLRLLLAAPIAATLDVERLLWIPEKKIFIPAAFDFESYMVREGLRILRQQLSLVRIVNREYECATYKEFRIKIATPKVGGDRVFRPHGRESENF